MATNFRNTLLVAAVLATSAPLAFGAPGAHGRQTEKERAEQVQKDKKAKSDREAAAAARQEARTQARPDVRQQAREQQIDALRERQQAQARAANQAARTEDRRDRQAAQVTNQAARTEGRTDRQRAEGANQAARKEARTDRQMARLSKPQQEQLITTQKTRLNSYRTWQRAQRTAAQQAAAAIQAQNRSAQYAYIQDYNNRLWQQQQRYMSQSINYYNDPYFYSAPSYRYMRDGAWYTMNSYGYNLLQQAINDGYGEGYRAGRADRMDGWRYDYRSSYVYQNASYGYSGYYMDRGDYSYYFRQGFQRGYEDGYYSRYRYGTSRNGSYSILGAVLGTILSLQAYDHRY